MSLSQLTQIRDYDHKIASLEADVERLTQRIERQDSLQARALLAVAVRKLSWYQARIAYLRQKQAAA